MLKQTKIIATISDLRCDVSFIRALYEGGMNVVRMNSAHLSEEGFLKIIKNTREVSDHIALLIDTKGPEIRTTVTDEPIVLKTGDTIKIIGNPDCKSSRETIYVTYGNMTTDLQIDDSILIDDGEIDLKVKEVTPEYLLCVAQNDGVIKSKKSVNVPGVRINLPSITPRDKRYIRLAVENDIDFIAHSFVRHKEDIKAVQDILDELNSPIKIIAKIENQEGVDNIDEILECSFGIMVARGDLGIEVAQEKIPAIQRRLIRHAIRYKKPVIVATQMLHSMIENPRPTRAEINDVANAIYYRTDAIMLSGETAYGKYPVEAICTMSKIARESEISKLKENDIRVPFGPDDDRDTTSYLAKQAVKSSLKLNTKAIVTDSHTGRTARVLAAYRGSRPVYAIAATRRLARELSISYGVWAEYQKRDNHETKSQDRKAYFIEAIKKLMDAQSIQRNDRIAYLGGSFGEKGGTTYLEIAEVSRILDAQDDIILPDYTNR